MSLSKLEETLPMTVAHARKRVPNFMAPCPLGKDGALGTQSGLKE